MAIEFAKFSLPSSSSRDIFCRIFRRRDIRKVCAHRHRVRVLHAVAQSDQGEFSRRASFPLFTLSSPCFLGNAENGSICRLVQRAQNVAPGAREIPAFTFEYAPSEKIFYLQLRAPTRRCLQVSACPTALPLPVYMADETAARGYSIYNELNRLSRCRDRPQFVDNFRRHDDLYDTEELTKVLGYYGSSLAGTRFNA